MNFELVYALHFTVFSPTVWSKILPKATLTKLLDYNPPLLLQSMWWAVFVLFFINTPDRKRICTMTKTISKKKCHWDPSCTDTNEAFFQCSWQLVQPHLLKNRFEKNIIHVIQKTLLIQSFPWVPRYSIFSADSMTKIDTEAHTKQSDHSSMLRQFRT